MKKFSIILFLFFTIASVSAQHKPYQFGFKLTGNIGWLGTHAEHFDNRGVKPGFSWGFVADFFLMENYSITTGFDMIFLNGKISYPYIYNNGTLYDTGTITNIFKTKYFQLPVVLTLKTNEIKGLRYYGQIGGALGFLINGRTVGDFKGTEVKDNNSDIFRFLRGAFIFGAGIEYPINGSTYLRTGLQFNNGFTNILKGDNEVYPGIKNDARNNYLELNVSIIF